MARNIYSVSPSERPILVRAAVQVSEQVIFVDDEVTDPFALVAPNQKAGPTRSARRSSCSTSLEPRPGRNRHERPLFRIC
jgi:hypothetical protein